MSAPSLALLRCPDCGGPLSASGAPAFARCPGCRREFTEEAGVCDLSPAGSAPLTLKTAAQFGASWRIHDHITGYHDRQFRDWIRPLAPADFAGRVVLEGGCGKGRHSLAIAGWNPARLLSLDLSDAVQLAAHNTADRDNVSCVRANLLRIPVADGVADIAVCVGVLHHLEDPQAGLQELWRTLKPGGTLCLWVYGREGNGWIVHFVDPVRKGITSRIPTRWLRPLLWPLSGFLFLLLKLLYGPLTARGARDIRWLPYSAYLGYISKFPFTEIEHITLDHLCPPIAYYLSRSTLESWVAGLPGAERAEYRWHNRNSWNVVATKEG